MGERRIVLVGPCRCDAGSYHDLSLDDARERMVRAGASPSAIDGGPALAEYQRAGGQAATSTTWCGKSWGGLHDRLAEFVADHAQFFNAR